MPQSAQKPQVAYYIKSVILMVLLALESYLITKTLLTFAQSEKYFMPGSAFLFKTFLLLLAILYTYFLTIGAWKKWEQYIIVPLPISLGIALGILEIDSTYAFIMFLTSYALLSYETLHATNLKNQLLKFKPRYILRFSTKGILFLFSLVAGILVLLHSAEKAAELDIGGKVGEIAQEQYEKFVEPKINTQVESVQKSLPTDPELVSMLSGVTGDTSSIIPGLPSINLDLRNTVEKEFNNIIEPYRHFIPPLIALLVFALIRFIGSFVTLAFNVTIDVVFMIFKGIGFLKINQVMVEKEEISFESSTE